MATNYYTDIQQLYVAYFKRPADPAGLLFWQGALEKGAGNLALVSAAFAGSAEYKANYANLSAASVIDKIYQNLFGRAAEPAGVAYWAPLLESGKLSIDFIVKNVADGALTSDKSIFANKVQASQAFTAALDLPQEEAAYASSNINVKAAAFVASIDSDASLAAVLVPGAMDKIVADMLNMPTLDTLSLAKDTLLSAGTDVTYKAFVVDNANTLQSGDSIAAGAGKADVLDADIGNMQSAAISITTSGIETISVRAIAAKSGADTSALPVILDASHLAGVSRFESDNSSADLIVVDAKVPAGLQLKDVGISMRETDAGNTDLGVYFDAQTLRDQGASQNVLRLQLIDTRGAGQGKPLIDLPYRGIAVAIDGVLTEIASDAIDAAQNYDDLVVAYQAAIASRPKLANLVFSKGAAFSAFDTLGVAQTGFEIVLTSKGGETFDVAKPGSGFLAFGVVPPANTDAHIVMLTDADTSRSLTASIVLDDVGRGGIGGDLIVGANNDIGVSRFEIEVRDNSQLQTIASTSNDLRDVVIRNGLTSSNILFGIKNNGNLSVLGATAESVAGTDSALLPGALSEQSGFGFTDVRTIDASAMVGQLRMTAQIGIQALDKYGAALPTAFTYSGGAGEDNIKVSIDSAVLSGSNSLVVNGGAGSDSITVTVTGNGIPTAQTPNIFLNGGAGDDQIRTAGNATVNGGTGNDVIVLSTTAGADRVVFTADFGNDVVQNLRFGAQPGGDQLDFTAFGARGASFAGTSAGSGADAITVQAETSVNDSLAEIANLYSDGLTAATRIFITYDNGNIGKVYQVVDSLDIPVIVTLIGSIGLGNTNWGNLVGANFA